MSYDAIVVGARCAGAATALLLARRGLRVLVVDQQREGRDTLSTHAVLRAGVVQLSRWGLLDALVAQGTPALRGSTFHYNFPDDEASETVDVRPAGGIDALYAPRRTVLDPLLVDAARRAGAEVRFETKVERLLVDRAGRVTGVEARGRHGPMRAQAPITIGADGVRSTVARAVDARVTHRGRAAGALAYRLRGRAPGRAFNWYYAPGITAGVIPTNVGVACVWAGVPSARFGELARPSLARGLDAVLARVPRSWPSTSARPNPTARCAASLAWRHSSGSRWDPAGRWSATRGTSRTRSPPTASPMPCVTPSCSPTRSSRRRPVTTGRSRSTTAPGMPCPPSCAR